MDEHEGRGEANDVAAYRFLSGAEMDPSAVLAAFPGARFVARARLVAAGEEAAAETWGILILTRLAAGAGAPTAGDVREVVADDGRRFRAAVVGAGQPAGDPAAILAAARYWELPPAYVRRLAGSVPAAADPD